MHLPGIHGWHHIEFAVYVVLVVLILYRPPAVLRVLSNAGHLLEAHFGDWIGLYILHLGIVLVILAGVWSNMPRVGELGYALVTAAMGVLKLTGKLPNGAGAPPATPSAPAPAAAAPALPSAPAAAAAPPAAPSPAAPTPPAGWERTT